MQINIKLALPILNSGVIRAKVWRVPENTVCKNIIPSSIPAFSGMLGKLRQQARNKIGFSTAEPTGRQNVKRSIKLASYFVKKQIDKCWLSGLQERNYRITI